MADKVKRLWSNVYLLAHYFRRDPRLSFTAFVANPLRGVFVCSWRGHHQDNVGRILGMCERCNADVLTPSDLRRDASATFPVRH